MANANFSTHAHSVIGELDDGFDRNTFDCAIACTRAEGGDGHAGAMDRWVESLLATHTSPTAGSGDDTRAACVTAVREDRDRIARRLNVGVIRGVFEATLRLSATAAMSNGAVRARLQLSIDDLDLIIAEVRATIFDCVQGSLHAFDELTSGSDLEPIVATLAGGQEGRR